MDKSSTDIAKEISKVVGIPKTVVIEFLNLITRFIAHEAAGMAFDHDDGKIKECILCIPEIGDMVVENTKDGITVKSFELNKKFCEYLKLALNTGSSKLCLGVEERVVDQIKHRYNSLI